jgi:hypothetical protein
LQFIVTQVSDFFYLHCYTYHAIAFGCFTCSASRCFASRLIR